MMIFLEMWKEREKEGTNMIKDQTRGVVDTWYINNDDLGLSWASAHNSNNIITFLLLCLGVLDHLAAIIDLYSLDIVKYFLFDALVLKVVSRW